VTPPVATPAGKVQTAKEALVQISPPDFNPSSNDHLLLAYVADLELEVDRLRKQGQYLRQAVSEELLSIRTALENDPLPGEPLTSVTHALDEITAVMRDLHDPPGYHPAHDQVTAIALRPLVEQVFRWQQRLSGASHAILHLELSIDTINWFPARLRHILDNLMSNALKYRDPVKGESRVTVSLNHRRESIELRVTDNGLGMPWDKRSSAFELFYRSAPLRNCGLGVGLAVVKVLIEQSGGSLSVESGEGKGSNFTAVLPRYDVGDYLT
jgi:signal transduction histidine kinase